MTPSCPRRQSRDAARTSLRLQVWRRRAEKLTSWTTRRQSSDNTSTRKSATRVLSSLETTSCSEHDPCVVGRKVACLQNQSCSQPSICTGKPTAVSLPGFHNVAQRQHKLLSVFRFTPPLSKRSWPHWTSRGGPVSPGCAKSIFSSLCVVTDCMVKHAPTDDKQEAKRQRKRR